MTKNSIIRLTLALMLVISMLLSLTSCLPGLGIGGDIFDALFPEDDGGDGGDVTPPDNDDDNGGIIPDLGGGDDITSDNYGDLYPGSGSGDTAGLSPLSKTLLSSVSIVCDFGASGAGAGSGVIYKVDKVKGDAYIITNYHVVYMSGAGRATNINVYLYGMQLDSYAVSASLVGGSVTYDIAVLKISGSEVIKNSYAMATPVASSESVRVFDRVYAVGNSEGMGMSATEGIVSVESENLELTGADDSLVTLRVMRIDAAVNHGNSGGGLFNEDGELIGIVVAKDVSSDVDNMGYAIPSDLVVRVADNVLAHCNGSSSTRVTKPLLGVTITSYVSGLEVSPDGSEIYQVNLVEVVEISSSSLASGKVEVGDIINSISIDGKTYRVSRVHHVTDAMLEARDGSVVVLNITRDGKTMEVSFRIKASDFSTVN